MIWLANGDRVLYQWTRGAAVLFDTRCGIVRISREDDQRTQDIYPAQTGGIYRAVIPDRMLRESGYLRVSCIFFDADGASVADTQRFIIRAAQRPSDYVHGSQETASWAALGMRMDALERAAREGRFDGKPGEDYVLTDGDKQEIRDAVLDEIDLGGAGVPDKTLTKEGVAADAKVTGEKIGELSEAIADLKSGGMSATSANLLITILRSGTYTTDQSDKIDALEAALGGGVVEPDEPDEPVEPEEPVVTLVGITAVYTGGDVVVGTALTELTGISVLATYSDGSTATVTDYTLTGEIAEGENTVTVTYEGLTATFTVTGYVEASYPFTPGEAYTIAWTDGQSINNTTGENSESTSMAVSDYLPCEGASAFEIGTGIYLNYGLFYYASDKTYLGKYGNANYPNNGYAIAMSFPAAYVRVQKKASTASGDTVTPVVFPVLTDITPWEAGVTYNGDMVLGSLNSNSGVETVNTTWYRSGFVLCYGAKTLSLHPADTGLRATICWYDSEKNFISGATSNGHVSDAVPENAYYFRFASAVYKPFFTLA